MDMPAPATSSIAFTHWIVLVEPVRSAIIPTLQRWHWRAIPIRAGRPCFQVSGFSGTADEPHDAVRVAAAQMDRIGALGYHIHFIARPRGVVGIRPQSLETVANRVDALVVQDNELGAVLAMEADDLNALRRAA